MPNYKCASVIIGVRKEGKVWRLTLFIFQSLQCLFFVVTCRFFKCNSFVKQRTVSTVWSPRRSECSQASEETSLQSNPTICVA